MIEDKRDERIGRLSKKNPADIVPGISKIIFHYLSNLSYETSAKDRDRLEVIPLLRCLIKNGFEFISPHLFVISENLIKHLNDPLSSDYIPDLLDTYR